MDKIEEIKTFLQAATPGPWAWSETFNEIYSTSTDNAIVAKSYKTSVNGWAENGILIAKAPEFLEYLLAQNDRLAEALDFYADRNSYVSSFDADDNAVMEDRGERARQALKGVNTNG